MEEETLLLLAKHQSEISRYTYMLVPDHGKIELVRDKGKLIQFAEAHGIPTPRTLHSLPTPEPCKVQGFGPETSGARIPQSQRFRMPTPNVVQDLADSPTRYPFLP